ncbi:hypothetical protein ACFL1M_03635 [Patescibacteria group bacterium]
MTTPAAAPPALLVVTVVVAVVGPTGGLAVVVWTALFSFATSSARSELQGGPPSHFSGSGPPPFGPPA